MDTTKLVVNESGRDIRLYYHDNGVLKKVGRLYHKHKSIDLLIATIQNNCNLKYYNGFWKNSQFVVVEYYNNYNSKIIGIYQNNKFILL